MNEVTKINSVQRNTLDIDFLKNKQKEDWQLLAHVVSLAKAEGMMLYSVDLDKDCRINVVQFICK